LNLQQSCGACNMPIMATKKLYVRTVPEARNALRRVLTRLAERLPDLVTQEKFVICSWLWMDQYDADALARELRPFLEAMRDRMASEPEPKAKNPGPFKTIAEVEEDPTQPDPGSSGVQPVRQAERPKSPRVPRRPRR
jgi:uncharacterized protein (DUF2267 family)